MRISQQDVQPSFLPVRVGLGVFPVAALRRTEAAAKVQTLQIRILWPRHTRRRVISSFVCQTISPMRTTWVYWQRKSQNLLPGTLLFPSCTNARALRA